MGAAAGTEGELDLPLADRREVHSATLLKRPAAVHKTLRHRCHCGSAFLPDAGFCQNCGAERPPHWHGLCYCGNAFSAEEAFCRRCGAPAEAMELLVNLKRTTQERLKWSRSDDLNSFESWNVNAKLESEFAYMHSLLTNRRFVEVVCKEFRDFDTDGNGSLDQQEVAQAIPKMVERHHWKIIIGPDQINHDGLIQDFFRQMDRDGDTRISMDEFLVYTAHFHYLCYQPTVSGPEIFSYEGKHKKKKVPEVIEQEACCKFMCG